MEVELNISSLEKKPDVPKTERLTSQEKPSPKEETNIPSDSLELSIRGQTIYSYSLSSEKDELSNEAVQSKKTMAVNAVTMESAIETVKRFDFSISSLADVKTLASATFRLAIEGMDASSIWDKVRKVYMADISPEELADAWRKKTEEMGLEETFELNKEELLSVVDELIEGKELKVINFLNQVANMEHLTGTDKEIYLHAHETIFSGVSTEEEKWRMITFEDGSMIHPQDFVFGLEMEAAYRGKDVKDLTKSEIMMMINLGPVDPMESGLKDILKDEERYAGDYVDTKGIDALMESIKKVDEYKAKEDEKEEEGIRGKWVKSKKKSPGIREILEEILAKTGAKEGDQKTSGQEELKDTLLKQERLAGIQQDSVLETNNVLLEKDALSGEKTSILKEYSRTTDYFESNGASLDPNLVDVTDEASSLLFIPPRTSASRYIDAVQ